MTSPLPSSSRVSLRDARVQDAASVTALLRAAVPEPLLSLMPLGQTGAEAWLADQLARAPRFFSGDHPSENLSSRFRVAVAHAAPPPRVVGVAEWRIVDQDLFLNQIGVHPAWRSQGVGTRLLHDGLRHDPDRPTVALDVFATNDRARRWYERLGFTLRTSNVWVEYSPSVVKGFAENSSTAPDGPDLPGDPYALFKGLDAADAMHATYGFSSFHLRAEPSASGTPETVRIGRLGDTHFRIPSFRLLRSRHVWSLLHTIDPARGVLYIGPYIGSPSGAEDATNAEVDDGKFKREDLDHAGRLRASSLRLCADRASVRSRLSSSLSSS